MRKEKLSSNSTKDQIDNIEEIQVAEGTTDTVIRVAIDTDKSQPKEDIIQERKLQKTLLIQFKEVTVEEVTETEAAEEVITEVEVETISIKTIKTIKEITMIKSLIPRSTLIKSKKTKKKSLHKRWMLMGLK